MVERQTYTAMPAFTGRNVPVTEIAKAMHKDAQYVRVGLQQGACGGARAPPAGWGPPDRTRAAAGSGARCCRR